MLLGVMHACVSGLILEQHLFCWQHQQNCGSHPSMTTEQLQARQALLLQR
jgi:hypothetical protein